MARLDAFSSGSQDDPNRGDIPAGILRQRRNLFVVSLSLFTIYYSGMAIEFSSLEMFGISASLQRPELIEDFWFLWIAWIYFLVRYMQYLSFYEVFKSPVFAFKSEASYYYTRAFRKLIEKRCKGFFSEGLRHVPFDYIEWRGRKGFWFIAPGNVENQYVDEKFRERVGSVQVLYAWIVAAVAISVKQRHFSDYFLPFVIAALPIAQIFTR